MYCEFYGRFYEIHRKRNEILFRFVFYVFHKFSGRFTINGPITGDKACTLTHPCTIPLNGYGMAEFSNVLVVSSSQECGDDIDPMISVGTIFLSMMIGIIDKSISDLIAQILCLIAQILCLIAQIFVFDRSDFRV